MHAMQGVRLEGKLPPESPLMVQPPADHSLGAAALCHYTWGSIFKDSSQGDLEVWKFDKRFYTSPADALKVRRSRHPPAARSRCKARVVKGGVHRCRGSRRRRPGMQTSRCKTGFRSRRRSSRFSLTWSPA